MSIRPAGLLLAPAAVLGAWIALPTAAPAQTPMERYVEVYGNDPCPPSPPGEIVVCARKPEKERYRIPQALRSTPGNGPNESWANKANALEYVGRSGTGSCSTSGPGGWTGCWSQMMRAAKADRAQSKAEAAAGEP